MIDGLEGIQKEAIVLYSEYCNGCSLMWLRKTTKNSSVMASGVLA
jgi:hypothetical protein